MLFRYADFIYKLIFWQIKIAKNEALPCIFEYNSLYLRQKIVIMEQIIGFINEGNDLLWTFIVIPLLVFCALFFTIRLGGAQFTKMGEMWRLLRHSTQAEEESQVLDDARQKRKKPISSFHAFAVSLSSRVGTGNLAGVASAIFIGGPGAVFWMWVMALFGAATAFVEATLAQLYKRRNDAEGAFYGGPAYYMQHGMHKRWMGVLFAVLITMTFAMANQLVQSNTLCEALASTTGIPMHWIGIAITIMTMLIIFGGIQRISKFAAIVVPFMAVGYILLSIIVIIMNISVIPSVIKLIVDSAFGVNQAVGGMVGIALMQGVKRGLFSNEAGEGSAPNAAAIAHTSHPIKQGLLQALGVFSDTIVICTCTAFIVLIAGLYQGDMDGIVLTTASLESEVGIWGRYFVTAAIFLFAYSTIIANYFYGETNVMFICPGSRKALFVLRILTGIVVLLGAWMTLQQTFSFVDLFMGLMTITNLFALATLSPKVFRLFADYKQQLKNKKDPVFHKSKVFTEQECKDIECWE